MSAVAILRAARERISDPARWTKHVEARNASGKECFPQSETAVCWCGVGAIWAESFTSDWDVDRMTAQMTLAAMTKRSVSDFNDDPTTTHADVLAAFDKAIVNLEGTTP